MLIEVDASTVRAGTVDAHSHRWADIASGEEPDTKFGAFGASRSVFYASAPM